MGIDKNIEQQRANAFRVDCVCVPTSRKKRGFGSFWGGFAKGWDWCVQNKQVQQVGEVVAEHVPKAIYFSVLTAFLSLKM